CDGQCVTYLFDRNNCGSCGHVCGNNAPCYDGACMIDCTTVPDNTPCNIASYGFLADGFCCNGSCLAFSDPSTCATGGRDCPSPACPVCPSGTACVAGAVCEPAVCNTVNEGSRCATSDGELGACCAGSCANLSDDSQNCGGCGHVCPNGQVCFRSVCVPDVTC